VGEDMALGLKQQLHGDGKSGRPRFNRLVAASLRTYSTCSFCSSFCTVQMRRLQRQNDAAIQRRRTQKGRALVQRFSVTPLAVSGQQRCQ